MSKLEDMIALIEDKTPLKISKDLKDNIEMIEVSSDELYDLSLLDYESLTGFPPQPAVQDMHQALCIDNKIAFMLADVENKKIYSCVENMKYHFGNDIEAVKESLILHELGHHILYDNHKDVMKLKRTHCFYNEMMQKVQKVDEQFADYVMFFGSKNLPKDGNRDKVLNERVRQYKDAKWKTNMFFTSKDPIKDAIDELDKI